MTRTQPAQAAGGVLRRLRGSTLLKALARLGLVGKAVFYLLLAVLAARLLVGLGRSGDQSNANGALHEVAQSAAGLALLGAAAVGFSAYALIRLAAAVTDDREGRLRRASTAGQALFYLAFAYVTVHFLLGARDSGSEQSQRQSAAKVLDVPGGRLVLVVVGVVVLSVCVWQLVVAVKGHFANTLHTEQMHRQVRRLTLVVARVGIPARAVATAPVGVFLVAAGLHGDAGDAKGTDALLLELSRSAGGRVVIALVATGFFVFAVYSLLEARYRQVSAGA